MRDSEPLHSQTSAAPRQLDQQAPLLMGRYRIMGAGEKGGFGTVLTCWDTRLQRRVAIKRMPLMPQGSYANGASTMNEALAEARTSSLLAHPNIVTVFDFEVDRSYAYLVMEYVDGLTLSQFLQRVEGGTLTGDECSYVVESVSKALSFAHENGVLHLDIKPSNIMIEHSGRIKLCDFGMATLASATGYGGARGGTVGYMPPEQIEGGMVDERSDVFSLAVVVWQALTGQNPFAASTAEESLRKIQRGPKPPLSKYDPAFAGMAEEALAQALEANPAQRVPSVEAFANEVVFGLGDPDTGAASIRSLMSQDEKDVASRDEEFRPDRLPLTYRYPWLEGALARGITAIESGRLTWLLVPLLLPGEATARLAGTLLVAAASAAWPPLGAALVGAVCVMTLALASTTGGASAVGLLLTMGGAAALLAWWVPVGTHNRLSSAAMLLPWFCGQAQAGSALAGFALAPGAACVTAVLGAAWCCVAKSVLAAISAGQGMGTGIVALGALVQSPATWIALAGSGVAASLASALYRRGASVASGIAGQVLGCLVLLASLALAARVENGGIWVPPSWDSVLVAITLCVFLCIATNLRGPLPVDEEVEDIDEPA